MGYDDSPIARLGRISLTSVSQAPALRARHAVAAAVERLDGGRTRAREVVPPPQLVVQGHHGRIPDGFRPSQERRTFWRRRTTA